MRLLTFIKSIKIHFVQNVDVQFKTNLSFEHELTAKIFSLIQPHQHNLTPFMF